MRDGEAFSDLIGRIYDCALDANLWTTALGAITDALGGVRGDLFVSDPLNRTQRIVAHYNWPEEGIALAVANASINPALPLGLTLPLGQVLCSSRDWDIVAFHRSAYWQNCYAGQGLYDYVVTPVTRTVTAFSSWGVIGSEAKGPYADADIELARLLSPHIKRAIEISGVIGRHKLESGTLRAALEALATPALIVEPDGVVLFRNAAADGELASGRIFSERSGRLIASTSEARKLLSVLDSSAVHRAHKGLDAFLTDATGRVLHATWAELEQAGDEMGSPILLLLREPEAALTTPLGSAAALYNLTRSEIQVLGQVLQGRVLAEIADIMGVARSTVKTHLDALYRKTGSNRQAELVSRIMSLASPLKR